MDILYKDVIERLDGSPRCTWYVSRSIAVRRDNRREQGLYRGEDIGRFAADGSLMPPGPPRSDLQIPRLDGVTVRGSCVPVSELGNSAI